MDNIALVIFSADINDDLWEVDDILINKYWPSHPPIYLLTETREYKNFHTINYNYPLRLWTRRIRKSLTEIKEDYIIFMCDDCFLNNKVNEELLQKVLDYMQQRPNAANINFELSFDENDIDCYSPDLKYRPPGTFIRVGLLCGLWKKDKLISILSKDCSPWDIEKNPCDMGYYYYILKNEKIISWLNDEPNMCGGIFQGKWHQNTLQFLQQEGIDINKLHYRKEVR